MGLHHSKYVTPPDVVDNVTMEMGSSIEGSAAPRWMRQPEVLHVVAYSVAALVCAGQLVAVIVTAGGWPTGVVVLVGKIGVAVSWRYPWTGLAITSAASFAVSAAGRSVSVRKSGRV